MPVPVDPSRPTLRLTIKRNGRLWLLGSVGATAAILMLAVDLAQRTPYPQRRLPDGETVGLVGITVHEPREVLLGSAWDRLLAQLTHRGELPRRVTLPENGRLSIWLRYSRTYFWRDAPQVVLRDSAGDEWLENGAPFGYDSLEMGGVEGKYFEIVPRRERQLTLRIYQSAGGFMWGPERWIDFPIANPLYRDYPVWEPEGLPATRRGGDLEVELTSLRTGMDFPEGREPQAIPYHGATAAIFRITRGGKPAPEWEPVYVTYTDATGNRLAGYEDRVTRTGDEIVFPMYGQLPSAEPAWKAKVELSRMRAHNARPDHTWLVSHLAIPKFDPQFGWQRTPLAPGVVLFSQLNAEPQGDAILNLRVKMPRGVRKRLELHGVDNLGHAVTDKSAAWRSLDPEQEPSWQIELDGKPRSLDLQVRAFDSRTVEFTVRPQKGG